MNKKSKYLLKSTTVLLPLALLLVAGNINDQKTSADTFIPISGLYQKQDSIDLDVSQGWKITKYTSNTQPDVSKIFLQGSTSATQKYALVQAATLGDSTLTAQKVIPMKKGHKYDLDLIYAQYYGTDGTGYIDFNGDIIDATDDAKDQSYQKTVTPDKDMDYTITVSFTTNYPGNAYFKLGYDKNSSGIIDTPTELEAPKVPVSPEAGTNTISGTASSGNTVVATDSDNKELGTATVLADGTFKITTNRPLRYNEKISIIQKNTTQTSPVTEVVVVDTVAPAAPVINPITDEDTSISGTAKPNSDIKVIFTKVDGSSETYTGVADSTGKFNISLEHTFSGKTKIVATATDEAGRVSPESTAEVTFKNQLTVNVTNYISSLSTNITGKTSRSNCNVTIKFNARTYEGKSDADGNYTIAITPHSVGSKFTVEATDPVDPENTATVDGKVLPRIPEFDSINSGLTVLKGVADPNAAISLTITRGTDTPIVLTATADAQGNFEIPLKDTDGKVFTLTIGDQLKYTATVTLTDGDLKSNEGSQTIFAQR